MSIPKYVNPTYKRLLEQVRIENEIAKKKEELYPYLFTLLADFLFSENELKRKFDYINPLLVKKDFGLNNLAKNLLFLYVANKNGTAPPKEFLNSVGLDFKRLVDSDVFPLGKKSLILFLVTQTNHFDKQSQKLNNQLLEYAEVEFKKRNYQKAVDIAFGCSKATPLKKYFENDIELIAEKSINWPREKIAKCIIWLTRHDFDSSKIVSTLEMKVEEEFNSWVKPDIWLAIIESEKLINSNIDKNIVEDVLLRLKEKNQSWATKINTIEENGIFIELDHLFKSPAFSPIEDTLSILALHHASRAQTIQVDESEYKQFDIFKKTINNPKIYSPQQLTITFTGIIIFSFLIGITITGLYQTIDKPSNLIKTINLADLGDFRFLLTPIGILLLLVFWLSNFIKKALSMDITSYKDFLLTCPLYVIIKPFISNNDT